MQMADSNSDEDDNKRRIQHQEDDDDDDTKVTASAASGSKKKRPPAQLKSDDEAKPSALIDTPRPHDVLFGRGRPLQAHPGNLRFHKIVNKFRDDYKTARKVDKVRQPKNGLGCCSIQVAKTATRSKTCIAFHL